MHLQPAYRRDEGPPRGDFIPKEQIRYRSLTLKSNLTSGKGKDALGQTLVTSRHSGHCAQKTRWDPQRLILWAPEEFPRDHMLLSKVQTSWRKKKKKVLALMKSHLLYSLAFCPVCCAWSCLTLCNPMDCSPPGSSVHRIFQARI